MKNKVLIFLAATGFALPSCGPNNKNTNTAPLKPTTGEINKSAPVTLPTTGMSPVPATTPASQAALPATAVALNPAHGMPRHRCDIPVGTPLNAPAKSNNNVATSPSLPAPTLPMPVVPGSVAAGTNPAHGQPGHDCSIAVGAPLKR